ncbi:MAG: hypothetical protein PVF83_14150 [Anaerolineales bacterium]|jgi:hypothetical protein
MQKLLRSINVILLVVIAVISGLLTVLDFFELIPEANRNYPLFTLFLLSMVGLHLIVSHFSQEDFRGDATNLLERISIGMSAIDYRLFNDSMEIESYLAKRMLEAKKSVCDLTWKKRISEGFSASNRQLAHTYMDRSIERTSDRISYREIFVFNDPRRVEKLERRLSENKKGYSCRYYESDTLIPRLQFVIVDDEEVFFFASAADSPLCSFRSKELSRVFRSYYEALWRSATPIKDGPRLHKNQLEKIRNTWNLSDNNSSN